MAESVKELKEYAKELEKRIDNIQKEISEIKKRIEGLEEDYANQILAIHNDMSEIEEQLWK